MHRAIFLLLLTTPARAQNPSPDTQLTQALLTEIRALRQDLQTTAATAQRVQIVMYRLQAETALLTRATQRLDESRVRCGELESHRRAITTELERQEEALRNVKPPFSSGPMEEAIARVKSNLAIASTDEQQCRARESEADSQFRTSRAKVTELEDQLDKIDKVLANVGR